MITRRHTIALFVSFAVLLALPAAAQADFGLLPGSLSAVARNKDGTITTQAGSHPYSYEVRFAMNLDQAGQVEGGEPRDFIVDLPPGFLGNPLATPRCPRSLFDGFVPHCPADTQIGALRPTIGGIGLFAGPIYNMVAPPGVAAQLGFSADNNNALQNALIRTDQGYGVGLSVQLPIEVLAVTATVWGVPADSGHDLERTEDATKLEEHPPVPSSAPRQPFLTMPTSCAAPPVITVKADSKLNPGVFSEQSAPALDAAGNPTAMTGCELVPFQPRVAAQPTTRLAESPSGLDFELNLPNLGWLDQGGIAETEPQKVEVTLPQGVTLNPSAAEGIAVCPEASYRAMSATSSPGEGCPEASKLGSIFAQSPLLEEPIEGALYLAKPYENPSGSLIGLYLVARAGERGVVIKQAGKVEPDPVTAQLTTTFEALPPLPYSDFHLHFREGARAPLVSPPVCGKYQTTAILTPFSTPETPATATSSFTIDHGTEGGPCPTGGLPPFHPGLIAGTLNNAAGHYSPFNLRLTRSDSEQEITHFSIKLPPGLAGKLAGIPYCSDAAIAAAKARTGPHGGEEELNAPSCPAASQVGRTLVGAGVGPSLAYAPGKLYLAGPYHGSALSIAAITAAKVGPFDLGTVVVREALKINPETAEVFIDATGSDPIPHIIAGVPVHLRDIRVYTDRPDFTLNPTNCTRTSTASTVLGSGTNFGSEADDRPVTVATPFQAADCASLGFAPKLALSLKGGTKRGDTPKLKATLTYPKGRYANIKSAQLTLPHSEFLEQAHIKTVCTRVQFAAGAGNGAQCPAASVYGKAKAITPLLGDPLEGPVFLRSSSHNLPDLVAALHNSQVDFDLVGRIDSVKGGRIRTTFESAPDVPVSSFTLEMQGGKKGLLVNSTNLCKSTNRALAHFTGQNGKVHDFNPVLAAQCAKAKKHKRK